VKIELLEQENLVSISEENPEFVCL